MSQEVLPPEVPVTRELILRFEEALRELPQIDVPVTHTFAGGIYAREVRLPAHSTCTGQIHRSEHFTVISQGDVTIVTESGGRRRVKAPCTFVSPPGDKRVVHVHEDTVWTTFHATGEITDVAHLEATLVANSYDELEGPQPPTLIG